MPGLPATPPTVANDGPWYIDLGMYQSSGNTNWDGNYFLNIAYAYLMFSASNGALNGARWWDVDFGPGGIWDIGMFHTRGNDIGIYSVQIDGGEVGSVDGYNASDAANTFNTISGVVIKPGRHRVGFVMSRTNPSSVSPFYYGALQHVFLRRTGSLPQTAKPGAAGLPVGPKNVSRCVDIGVYMSSGNTSWNLYFADSGVNNQYVYTTTNGGSRWWYVGLAAGTWDINVLFGVGTSYGIVAVQVDDVTVGTFDSYSASVNNQVPAIIRAYIPASGRHKIALTVTGHNGSSSGFAGVVKHIFLNQVRATRPIPAVVEPWQIDIDAFYSTGNTNWNTLVTSLACLYEADMESSGAQNASRWWDLHMSAGTWDFEMMHETGPNRGIYSVQIDGLEVGTVDGYAAGASTDNHATLTGIKVPFTGKHRFAFVMATKNASSSNYFGTLTTFQLRRTA